MEEELKPCPFCGGRGEIRQERDKYISTFNETTRMTKIAQALSVHCEKCEMQGPVSIGKDKAIAAWNALPRRVKWTREKPTQEGWYWHHQGLGFGTVIEYIDLEIGIPGGVLEDELWAGPIPEPEESCHAG